MRVIIVGLALLALALSSCGSKISFGVSPEQPRFISRYPYPIKEPILFVPQPRQVELVRGMPALPGANLGALHVRRPQRSSGSHSIAVEGDRALMYNSGSYMLDESLRLESSPGAPGYALYRFRNTNDSEPLRSVRVETRNQEQELFLAVGNFELGQWELWLVPRSSDGSRSFSLSLPGGQHTCADGCTYVMPMALSGARLTVVRVSAEYLKP